MIKKSDQVELGNVLASCYPDYNITHASLNSTTGVLEAWVYDLRSSADPLASYVLLDGLDAMARDEPDTSRSQASRLLSAQQAMNVASMDLQRTADNLQQAFFRYTIQEFWDWFQNSRRQKFSMSLFHSWLDLYPDEAVAAYAQSLSQLLRSYLTAGGVLPVETTIIWDDRLRKIVADIRADIQKYQPRVTEAPVPPVAPKA